VLDGLLRIGFLYPQQIIWNKGRAVLTRTHYWYQHEPCWYVRKKNAPWFGEAGKCSTIWDSPSPKFIMGGSNEEKFDHPTQKPVELMRRPILNHTKHGELVYEPFLGSGTTLAAAELLGYCVDALAGLCLRRFDLEIVLLGGGGQKAPHAVGLPVGRLHDLGEGGAFGPCDHRQDFGTLMPSARGAVALAASRLADFLPALASFLGVALAFPPLAAFWLLGAPFLWLAWVLRGGLLRRDVRALFRNGSGCVGFCVGHVDSLCHFLRQVWRMTSHHSDRFERQGKNERSLENPPTSEHMAIVSLTRGHAAAQSRADHRADVSGRL
jgi:hypothetical protein